MNGAQAMIRTLVDSGVDVCFMNPGTSEMHFVHALDAVPEMRGVLALFEGVATGAADGYARMADKPAAVLLHLGPGLGNGLANLHNARRAEVPIVNVVGDHATYHAKYDAPLQSDIASIAKGVSTWVRSVESPESLARDTADAVAASYGAPGQVATLIVPADTCWLDSPGPVGPSAISGPSTVPSERIEDLAAVLRSGEPAALLVGGSAMRRGPLRDAARVGVATGAKVLSETFPTRAERGAGTPAVDRLAYLAEFAQMQMEGLRHLVLVDAAHPVSFFAYPDKASDLVPEGCQVHVLSAPDEDAPAALAALAAALDAPDDPPVIEASRPDRPTGPLNAETMAAALGALLPEGAIVADEGNTTGLFAQGATAGAPPHDWLTLTGGAIGYGLPAATGAAVAAPDRKVICLEADGSAMYTAQALWTQAREGLDVTTVILNNGSYAVLNMELSRVGAGDPGPRALSMLDIPGLDFVSLATSMGVPGTRATTAEEFTEQLEAAIAIPGPALVEAVVPSTL
ncbi:acetolactate synthase large subunit [Dermatobacter hominis]|uniref:acetolactate synthase large subunit n=1 Tax=Dermatobacter hominis TaxID=2884263 RepID=UPI001D0FE958|nr:acetolactate synthase large subunit [Dermatobacter hominis]UDY36510.1 acetolactate synthase large subunit [Dermatobacter hominis]